MKCEEVRGRIDALVDGELSAAEAIRAREHIEGCASCRAQEHRLRALLAEASGLPEEIQPPRDLWGGISEEIAPRRAPARSRRVPLFATGWSWQGSLAAAAILVVAGGAAVLALLSARGPARTGAALPVGPTSFDAGVAPAGGGDSSVLMPADLAFIDAKQRILAALDERKDVLSPETVAAIQENLLLIESAVGEIHAALDKDPGNRALQKMLVSARRREVAVLRQVTQTAAMRER
jgi:hypothetical protein